MSEPLTLEQKVVFAVSMIEDNLLILLGVPSQAWEYMKDGKTHMFDLSKIGLPIRIMMYGGPDHATVRAHVDEYNRNKGADVKDMTDKDFSF